MEHEDFFDEASARSKVKARLVAGYFAVLSDAILGRRNSPAHTSSRLAYVDLCAGPGRYDDGTPSTPLLVLAYALQQPDLAERLIAVFNDLNNEHIEDLRQQIDAVHGIETLAHPPIYSSQEVGQKLLSALADLRELPSLWFVDPWGFKELTLGLFSTLMQGGQAELILFFNFNRVNMALGDPTRPPHLTRLFGRDGFTALQSRLSRARPEEREPLILNQVTDGLRGCGAQFITRFRFYDEDGVRTSHYIVHATSSAVGHSLMSEVMEAESSFAGEYGFHGPAKAWALGSTFAGLAGWLRSVREEPSTFGTSTR